MNIVVAVRCLNEVKNIERFLKGYDFADTIVVSDGGSTDGSLEILNRHKDVHILDFPMGEERNGYFWNMDAPHINFVLDYAKSLKPDWIIFDDMDCVPNLELRGSARQILENCEKPQVNAFRLYLWGDDEYFPKMCGNFSEDYTSLWAWRPDQLDIRADPEIRHGTIIGLDPDPYIVKDPLCLLHKSWYPDTIEEKIRRYNALGLPFNHPFEFAGERQPLPPWAIEAASGERDFVFINRYLNELQEDIYPQPEDSGHFELAKESIKEIVPKTEGVETVLDVGCGEGFCEQLFQEYGIRFTGVCVGRDYRVGKLKGRNVFEADFSFLKYDDNQFDMVYSRHSLEHSPMPLLTLMEWRRVSKKYVALVLPAPEHWRYGGKNHYFVLQRRQWLALFEAAKLEVVYESVKRQIMKPDGTPPDVAIEYWFLLRKK